MSVEVFIKFAGVIDLQTKIDSDMRYISTVIGQNLEHRDLIKADLKTIYHFYCVTRQMSGLLIGIIRP